MNRADGTPAAETPATITRYGTQCPFCMSAVPGQASVCAGCGAEKTIAMAGWSPLLFLAWLAVLFALGVFVLMAVSWGWEKAGLIGAIVTPVIPGAILWFALKGTYALATKARWSR